MDFNGYKVIIFLEKGGRMTARISYYPGWFGTAKIGKFIYR